MPSILAGFRVLSLAPNVPGPVAAARLRDLGARVKKIESPGGDLLEAGAPQWYARLHDGIETQIADLKSTHGKSLLEAELADTDVLLTSLRLSALERMGFAWPQLHAAFPRAIHVAIVGEASGPERPGHDLTYLADAGLLEPFALPRTLFVDLAGAERAVASVLGALLHRERTGEATQAIVSLASMAQTLAEPLRAGLTGPGKILGGGYAGYRIYATADGFVALAAIEPHFFEAVCDALLSDGRYATLSDAFVSEASATWERFARERDLPLTTIIT